MDANATGTPVIQNSKPELFSNRNLAIACGVFAFLACCACIASGVAFIAYYGREPETLSLEYSLPNTVARGEEFELVLTLTNTGSEDMYISDIDLDEAFDESILDGAIVISTDPAMGRDFSTDGIKSFEFNRNLPGGSTQEVVFRMEAVAVGDYGGSVGVYVGDIAGRIDYVGITITED